MAIRILPKFNSGNSEPEPERDANTESIFTRLTAKLKYEQAYIKPALGNELYPLYRDNCVLFLSGNYVGRGYGNYRESANESYEQIGWILARM